MFTVFLLPALAGVVGRQLTGLIGRVTSAQESRQDLTSPRSGAQASASTTACLVTGEFSKMAYMELLIYSKHSIMGFRNPAVF